MTGRIVKLKTPAASTPVSLDDMKSHLRVEASDDDDLIGTYIAAAVSSISEELARVLITQTWNESMACSTRDVYLSVLPAQSLVSVKYYDADNLQQTANLSEFTLYSADDWAFVRSENWPTVYDRPDAITVEYTAGFGSDTDVPAHLCQAIKLVVGHWYESREDASEVSLTEIPRGAAALIGLSRGGWYG